MSTTRILIAISITFLISSLYLYQNLKQHREQLVHLETRIENKNVELKNLFKNIIMQQHDNCTLLSPEINLISIDNHKISLSKLVEQQPRVILVLPDGACNSCSETAFERISDLLKKLENNNLELIVITDIRRIKETISFFEQLGLELNIYGLKPGELPISLVQYNSPFLFVVEHSLRCQSMFILSKNHNELNRMYLNDIISRFAKWQYLF